MTPLTYIGVWFAISVPTTLAICRQLKRCRLRDELLTEEWRRRG
jgi:hypothetical protein